VTHLLIKNDVSEIHDTILGACIMHTTEEISWPLDPSFAIRGEFRFGKKGVDVKSKTVCVTFSRLIITILKR
jgi:hypothetical protein